MGILDRFRRTPSEPAEPAAPAASSEVTDEEVREAARNMTHPGFRTRDEVVTGVGEHLEIEGDPRVPAIVDAVWAARLAEEAAWDAPGDHARVEAAFTRLAEEGIVGRMSFTCCQTCGTAEIDDERTPLDGVPEGEYPYREWGYTFFHEQDAERLTDEPSTLFLSYSTFCPAPDLDPSLVERWRGGEESLRREVVAASDAAAGHRVAQALRDEGLHVDWDGDTGQRIQVAIDAWRKPLPR